MLQVLVCDMAGSGYRIMWSGDGVTWITQNRTQAHNFAEVMHYLERTFQEGVAKGREVRLRWYQDFYCRIPADLVVPGTRVI